MQKQGALTYGMLCAPKRLFIFMANEHQIPLDLPRENALMFSFLKILEAVPFAVRFNGNMRSLDKPVPCFEYAVDSWSVVNAYESGEFTGEKEVELQVNCAIWKEKVQQEDCRSVWSENPDGTPTGMPFAVGDFALHEAWKQQTFYELELIIRSLIDENLGLVKLFGWQLQNEGRVNYLYAKDATSNKYYGIVASFSLRGYYFNCCPSIDKTLLSANAINSLGYITS